VDAREELAPCWLAARRVCTLDFQRLWVSTMVRELHPGCPLAARQAWWPQIEASSSLVSQRGQRGRQPVDQARSPQRLRFRNRSNQRYGHAA